MANYNTGPLFNYFGYEIGNILNGIGNEINRNINQNNPNSMNNNTNNLNNQNINQDIFNKSDLKYYQNHDDQHIYLCLEIQGFDKQDCKINLNGGYLIFEGKSNYNVNRNEKFDENDFKFIKNKVITKKIDLSNFNIDENNIIANFDNGLLKIKLKKKPKMNINID